MNVLIINGPNLNLLGTREPEIYGNQTFENYFKELVKLFPKINLTYFQTNHEGYIIDKLHAEGFTIDAIILNPGAYTHYSYAIADAIKAITTPVIEVHISNINQREEFRRISVTSPNCKHMVTGMGLNGYAIAIEWFLNKML